MSTLRVDTIQNAAGTDSPINVPGTAKAWVNFNGTGTVAIRASYNVSSITDNGTGDYTVNFTTAMADANYTVVTSSDRQGGDCFNTNGSAAAPTSSGIRLQAYGRSDSYTAVDITYANVAIFR